MHGIGKSYEGNGPAMELIMIRVAPQRLNHEEHEQWPPAWSVAGTTSTLLLFNESRVLSIAKYAALVLQTDNPVYGNNLTASCTAIRLRVS